MEAIIPSEEERALPPAEPVNQYPIETAQEPAPPRNWWLLAALIAAALALSILVVLTGRWVYHKSHNKVTPAPAQTQDLPKPPPTNL